MGKFIIAAYPRIKKEDVINEMNKIVSPVRLQGYVRETVKYRSKLSSINENEFEEILTAYRKRYAELTGQTDFYEPNYADIQEMILIARHELKEGRKTGIVGIEYAVNLALKYQPNHADALSLKRYLEKV